jgi:hypothetical protein
LADAGNHAARQLVGCIEMPRVCHYED